MSDGMRCVGTFAATLLYLILLVVPMRATAVTSTEINVIQLQIEASSGFVQFLSPFRASALIEIEDSLGLPSRRFSAVDDNSTQISTGNATATGSGEAEASTPSSGFPAFHFASASDVTFSELSPISGFATSTAIGAVGPAFGSGQGLFEITDPVNSMAIATFNATLDVNQLVHTVLDGVAASSEVIFELVLPDLPNETLLLYDNPLSVGPNLTQVFSDRFTLTGSVTLQTNTPYRLISSAISESSGLNIVPEPPALVFWDQLLRCYGSYRFAGTGS